MNQVIKKSPALVLFEEPEAVRFEMFVDASCHLLDGPIHLTNHAWELRLLQLPKRRT